MVKPLADRMRPQSIDHIVGQHHLLDKSKALRSIIENGKIPNMIFYGPSGIGKTTLASIIAKSANMRLHKLNCTTASTSDIKDVIAEIGSFAAVDGILLYLDEIQYFNKKQQQFLLEYIENGSITLIASTTENPYFYIYNAILSRCTVFEFKPVDAQDIKQVIIRAKDFLEQEGSVKITFEDDVVETISFGCNGDVRKAINAVELCVLSSENTDSEIKVTLDTAKQLTQKSSMRYDRDGDQHYDILSAFQKAMRGSDPDASIHYLARLLQSGDLQSACRRLLICACEDVGIAYPQIIPIVKSCVDSALQVGLPEAEIPLADAVIMVALAPKSNSANNAIKMANKDILDGNFGDIPAYLKDGHYSGANKLGKAIGYKYPHDYENSYIKQQYLPNILKDKKYYKYANNKNEQAFKSYWDKIKK